MKNFLVWIIILLFVGYVVYAVVRNKPTETIPTAADTSELKINESQTQPQNTASSAINRSTSTTKNGMTIEIIKEGNGTEIKNGQIAVVNYTGSLIDGKVFDSSIPRGEPFSFTLGAGQVIKGWDQGVLGMKIGEVRKLTIPSELAYGSSGAGGVIPPNATLIFEVTLLAIK